MQINISELSQWNMDDTGWGRLPPLGACSIHQQLMSLCLFRIGCSVVVHERDMSATICIWYARGKLDALFFPVSRGDLQAISMEKHNRLFLFSISTISRIIYILWLWLPSSTKYLCSASTWTSCGWHFRTGAFVISQPIVSNISWKLPTGANSPHPS